MFWQAFKNIDDILHKDARSSSELDYTGQTSWLLFLKHLDALEQGKVMQAELEGKDYAFLLEKRYRWESWAFQKFRTTSSNGDSDHQTSRPWTLRHCAFVCAWPDYLAVSAAD